MASCDVIVLGAGMAGIAAALHLQDRGRSVVVVDRKAPGQETSFGNAGIIQTEAVEPFAMKRDRRSLISMALGRGNDVRYRLAAMPGHAGPLSRYWWHSAPARHRALSASYAGIVRLAVPEHRALVERAGAADLVQPGGYRVLLRTQAESDEWQTTAERLRATYGVGYATLTAGALAAAEPGLNDTGVGAIHWTDPWSVRDPGALVTAYARLFTAGGGTVLQGDAAHLSQHGSGWRVPTGVGAVEAPAAVVALGPWSPSLMQRFGSRFPLVRKRGYHAHFQSERPLTLPLLDPAFGYVMAPMTRGMRITSGAELSGRDAPPTPVQLRRAEQAARGLMSLGPPVDDAPWLGTRPCMPDMLPVIGRARHAEGLWLHFGHGHQGLTLGPATGRLLAEMMTGEPTVVDPVPFRPDRYR